MKGKRTGCAGCDRSFVLHGALLVKYNGNCERLRLPGFIYYIGHKAFEGNKTLKALSLSSNILSIGEKSFADCENLGRVDLPYGVETIGGNAFKGCTSLSILNFNGTKEHWLSLKKGEGWYDGTPDFLICCNDGTLSKQDEIEFEAEPCAFKDIGTGDGRPLSCSEDAEDSEMECETPAMSDNELQYRALKVAALRSRVSLTMFQQMFSIGYVRARSLIMWMSARGFVELNDDCEEEYKTNITPSEFNNIYAISMSEEHPQRWTNTEIYEQYKDILQFATEKIKTLIRRVAEKKSLPITAAEEPSHSLWGTEELQEAVTDRLKKLILSDRRMGRRGAIKKAETYLEAVRDTHDRKMVQVYERMVYELKSTSDYTYVQLRKQLFDGKAE